MPSRPAEPGRGLSGSGVVVDAARGLILTVEPVVQGASRVAVVLADGREIASERVARDPRSELVLLTVDPKAAPFQPVDWAEDRGPSRGRLGHFRRQGGWNGSDALRGHRQRPRTGTAGVRRSS